MKRKKYKEEGMMVRGRNNNGGRGSNGDGRRGRIDGGTGSTNGARVGRKKMKVTLQIYPFIFKKND